MRTVDKAGAAIAAVTQAGANVLSGPDLRVGDPEAASRSAYANAYKAARARAETYAQAANLKVARDPHHPGRRLVQRADGLRVEAMMDRAAPQAVAAPPPVMAGTNTSQVSVSVDFALAPKVGAERLCERTRQRHELGETVSATSPPPCRVSNVIGSPRPSGCREEQVFRAL